jgi:uncharacterized membrane-anchored protein YjiN (DUF445 family)
MENDQLLQSLGLTKEEMQERIINNAVKALLRENGSDEDGECECATTLSRRIGSKIEKKLDAIADDFVEKRIGAHVMEYIEKTLLNPTDHYGTKKGNPRTFAEYVIERFDSFLKEKVNEQGTVDRYHDGCTERGAWLVMRHIREAIEKVIKESLGGAVNTIKDGIAGQIKNMLDRTFVEVSTKVIQK